MESGGGVRRGTERDRPDASLPLVLVWAFAILAAAQAIYYYPRMPDVMATHFAFARQANGWSGKTSFVIWFGLAEALFLFLGFGIPWLLRRMPAAFVNIPHRELWFNEPHRERTIEDLSVWMLWFSAVTLAFLVATAQFIYLANLGADEPTLARSFVAVVGAFIAAMVWLVFLVFRRFGRKPSR